MPIASINSDYTGRTKDIHIFQGVNPNKVSTITPSFGKISNYCAGVQKLIQRYAISLLTRITSQPGFPTFGTSFLDNLTRRNALISTSDLRGLFNFANLKVVNEFREFQRSADGLPDDEKLDTAVLVDITTTADSVSMTIKIYPVATPAVNFILPIPLNN